MKQEFGIIFLLVSLGCPGCLVHSQSVDSCDNNNINFNGILNFKTTAMSCQIVWQEHDFILRVMALVVRPQKGSKMRQYWNLYHHNAGKVLVVLATSNIFYGIRLGMEGASWYGTYAVIVALLLASIIVLELRLRRRR